MAESLGLGHLLTGRLAYAVTAIFVPLVVDCHEPPAVVTVKIAAENTAAFAGIVKVNEVPALLTLTAELATVTVPTFTVDPERLVPVIVTVPTPRLVPD